MPQALLYADERSLAAYLGGAALVQPALAETPCRAVALAERDDGGPTRALLFADDELDLPEPPESAAGTRLCSAAYDAEGGTLTVPEGRRRVKLAVDEETCRGRLAQVLRPLPWLRPPEHPELVYLCEPGKAFAELVSEHLELGRDQLRYAPVRGEELGLRLLLEVSEPSWFILERWAPRHDRVRAFRRLSGTLGPRRVFLEWGYEHPLESALIDPADEDVLLLIDREGRHLSARQDHFADVGDALALDPATLETEELVPGEEPERIAVPLRLEGRVTPLDPELWLLPIGQRERLEQLLTQTPEEELRNLMVACLSDAAGERFFAVREVLTGRAPRLLPLGSEAYAPMAGLPNLLVPCDLVVAPPLSNDRYARAFGLTPGALTILAERGEGDAARLLVRRIEERAFQPIERIVDFVVDADAERVEQVVLAAPFDLGEFAEEDLVPAAVEERPRRETPPAPQPDREPARDAGPTRPARPRERGLLQRIAGLFGPGEEEAAQAPPTEADPRRQEIAALQERIVLEEATPSDWWRLSVLLQADDQPDDALLAAENALWDLRGDEADEALRELAGLFGQPGASPQTTADLYQRLFAYRSEVASIAGGAGQAERYRAATEAVYALLHEWEGRLRKKSRWLLWSLVLRETRDAIEEERQREDLLSELVLRGIEEREVPPFVRRVLLDYYGHKAATGSGAAEALAFLEGAQRYAASLDHPALRAEALAHVAWALAELGEPQRAHEAALLADRHANDTSGAPAHLAFRARAGARVGAVLERVSGRDKGRKHLEKGLATVLKLLEEGRDNTQEYADGNKGFAHWFGVLADALGAQPRHDDPLLQRGLEELVRRPPDKQVQVLTTAARDLQRLGAAPQARQLGRDLLAQESLRLMHLEDAVKALEVLGEGQPVTAADAERIEAALLERADDIDEFSIDMLLTALRAQDHVDPWEVTERLRGELAARGHDYAGRLVRLAGLRRLAERRDRQRGPERLVEALEDAWGHEGGRPPGTERMRLVVRLAALVPAFGMRERGLGILNGIKERAVEEKDVFIRNELLMATAEAASKLGESRDSLDLIQEVAERAVQSFETQQRGWSSPTWVLFETLQKCVKGAAAMGDSRRGLALVRQVADAARAALKQASGSHDVGRYFYCQTLVLCGPAALELGDREAAEVLFQESFSRLTEFQGQDLIDLLNEAKDIAGELDGAHRYQLARQVLEAAQAPRDSGDLFERFAVDLTAGIARTMVQGESAYAAALKRWKGGEERAIRDRVALERPSQS